MWRGPNRRGARWGGRGVTLIEALISTALFAFVMTGVYMLYTTMQGTLSRGEMKTDLQQSARIGMNRMVREIRMLGYDPQSALGSLATTDLPLDSIRAASPNCLSFLSYYNDTEPSPAVLRTIQVTYYLDGTTLKRRQDSWGGSSFTQGAGQPQAELVSLLTFTYYNRDNAILSPSTGLTYKCPLGTTSQPSSQLSYYQIGEVSRVAIKLQTLDSRPGTAAEYYTLTSDVFLRNR